LKEQLAVRRQMRARYLAEVRRVTGVAFVIQKIHKHRDAQRHAAFLAGKAALVEKQQDDKQALAHRQDLQATDIAREVLGAGADRGARAEKL
jgi:hypothetical protein